MSMNYKNFQPDADQRYLVDVVLTHILEHLPADAVYCGCLEKTDTGYSMAFRARSCSGQFGTVKRGFSVRHILDKVANELYEQTLNWSSLRFDGDNEVFDPATTWMPADEVEKLSLFCSSATCPLLFVKPGLEAQDDVDTRCS